MSENKRSMGLIVGAAASASMLAVLTAGSLGAFTASITNDTNTAGVGSLVMEESGLDSSGSTTTCTSTDGTGNSVTCSSINKYGGSLTMTPGGSAVTTTITISNKGTVDASTFTLTPGACTQSTISGSAYTGSATDLCSKLIVTVSQDGTQIYSGPASAFTGAKTLTPVKAGASSTFTFATKFDASADNTYQGLQASQPLIWAFQS